MKGIIEKVNYFLINNKISLFVLSMYGLFFKMCGIPLEKSNNSKFIRKIGNYYKEHPRMDYVFLIGSIIFVSMILFYRFIFGNEVFLFSELDPNRDQICNYYPYIYHLFHHKEALSWWSFNSGMGNNMFPMINQFFLDPFNIINAIFWNPMENGFVYMLILKLICISVVFYRLALILTGNRYVSFLTALLFSFNGFIMFMGQHWFMVNKVFAFVFLLLSIEIYFKSKIKWWLLLIALTINISDIYFFIQSAFFIGVYLLFRSFLIDGTLNKIPKQVLKLSILTVVSGLLASVIILPFLAVIGNGPRLNLNHLDIGKLIFSVNDFDYYLALFGMFFSNNLNGNATNFFGWYDFMRSPILYSGLLTLLILPQLFFMQNKNQKRALIFISLISLITVIFPFFGYLFNGFQELYFRWTYGVITFNLLSVAIILNAIYKDKTLNLSVLKITLAVLFFGLLLFWMYYRRHDGEWKMNYLVGSFYSDKNHYIQNRLIILFSFLTAYFILLHFINKYKVVVAFLFIIIIGTELIVEHSPTFYERGLVKKNHNPYQTKFARDNQILLNRIKKNDLSQFYRIEQQYYPFGTGMTRNNSLAQNYYGLKSYTSFNSKSTYEFCSFFNLIKKGHWANILPSWEPNIQRYSLLNVLSVKYLLSKDSIQSKELKLIDQYNGIKVYRNLNSLPLGVTYKHFITESKLQSFSDTLKDKTINSKLVIQDKDVKKLKSYFQDTSDSEKFKILKFRQSDILGSVHSNSKQILFFSIPYDKGWEISINNKKVDFYKVNVGFIGVPIEKGLNKINLKYTPPLFKLGMYISIFTFCGILLFYLVFSRRGIYFNR